MFLGLIIPFSCACAFIMFEQANMAKVMLEEITKKQFDAYVSSIENEIEKIRVMQLNNNIKDDINILTYGSHL